MKLNNQENKYILPKHRFNVFSKLAVMQSLLESSRFLKLVFKVVICVVSLAL